MTGISSFRCKKQLAVIIVLVCSCLLPACKETGKGLAESERSAFKTYVDSLDEARLQQQYNRLLANDTSRWKLDQAIRQHYANDSELKEKPFWFTRMGVSVDADSMLSYLRHALPLNGLDTAAFFVQQIAEDLAVVRQLSFDSVGRNINEVLPHLDYYLSKAYVRYTLGQRYGFIRPDKLLNKLDHKAHSDNPNEFARLFDYELKAPDYEESVRQLKGSNRIGYLNASAPDSPLYKVLQAQLSKTKVPEERRKVSINMERCRWNMAQPNATERHIVVNIAAQQLWAVCPDSVLPMRICCGAIATKTPLLYSAISYMQVNPDWIIPQNIVKAEVAHHAGDSVYFARNNYYIVDRSTNDTLKASEVSRSSLERGGLRVGQYGGAGNSLGRIVFRFPNNFSVYLHDTNNRGAFKRERRTLSHGCVRVEKPFELAQFLLCDADDWKLDQLRLSMDMKPETERGKKYLEEHEEDPRPLRLITYHGIKPAVPLFIVYYTVYPNPESGLTDYWPDLYGYDKAIEREIGYFLLKK